MDPGRIVWLPGSGFSGEDMNQACNEYYPGSYACGEAEWQGWTEVYCCY